METSKMQPRNSNMMSYKKFFAMMGISFIIMYWIMFLNVDEVSHIYLSTTRIYMSLLMVSAMAVVMMLMMGTMYSNKRLNTGIVTSGIVVFGLVLAGLRTQTA